MRGQRYIKNVSTVELDVDKCIGCGMCSIVCPHRVFSVADKKARIVDRDLCIECGACSTNCPVDAIRVDSGVGCAAAVLNQMFGDGDLSCDRCCGDDCKKDSCC